LLHPNLSSCRPAVGRLSLGYALLVLLTAGCTQDFGAFRGGSGGGGGPQGGQGGTGGNAPVCENDCNDSNPCTQDICDPDGNCLHPAEEDPPLTQVLQDCKQLACEGTELVTSANPDDLPDDDGNPCTAEECNGDMPSHPPVAPGTACNDGGVCNATGQCSDCDKPTDCGIDTVCATFTCVDNTCETEFNVGDIISGADDGDCMALQCADGEPEPQDLPYEDDTEDDGNGCTMDTCSAAGDPVHTPDVGATCSDNQFCTATDTCNAAGVCVGAGDPCSGGPVCNNICNEGANNCFSPTTTTCGSSAVGPCSDADTCDGAGACSQNNAAMGSVCTDGIFCNGTDQCDASGGCTIHPMGNPCVLNPNNNDCSETCNEALGNCTANDPAGSPCNDSMFCNGTDTCNGSGVCTPSAVNPCLPLVTTDNDCSGSCNEGTDMCTMNDPAATGCNDNNQCTTSDACNASGVCASTNVANGTACTIPAPGTCQNGVCTP
jgi:hypothetical protein